MALLPSRSRPSFGRRMLLLVALCTVVPGAVFGYLSLRQIEGKFRQETARRMRLDSRELAMAIHSTFSEIKDQVEFLAGIVREDAFRSIGPATKRAGPFRIGPLVGATLYRDGLPPKTLFGPPCPPPASTASARAHLADGHGLLYLQRDLRGANRFFLAHAVRGEGHNGEVLACEVNPEYLWERVRSATPPVSEVSVLAPDGTPLFETSPMPAALRERVERERKQAAAGNFEWAERSDALLVDHVALFLRPAFASEDWTVAVRQPRSEAYAVANRFTRLLLLSVALVVLVAGLIAHVQLRRNIAPLAVLKEGTRRISEGDFESRVETGSGDEFEELARSFNGMADRLGREFRLQTEMGRIVQAILAETSGERIARTLLGLLDSVVPCGCAALILCDASRSGDTAATYLRENPSGEPLERHGAFRPFSADQIRRLASLESSAVAHPLGEFGDFRLPWSGARPSALLLAPIVSGGELLGVLLAGYPGAPDASPETRSRLRQVADQAAIALNRARLLDELTETDLGTLQALARAVDTNSPWTAGHSQRVTALAVDIGREMSLPPHQTDLLRRGGLLHDIGKIGIPASVLDKPGRLTDAETALVKEHPVSGARILGPIPSLQKVLQIVSQHHEWFDGSGYPLGLAGNAISLHARILSVADVFDALSSDRPYRAAWNPAKVVAYLRENAGSQFDPEVVAAFLRLDADRDGAGASEVASHGAADALLRMRHAGYSEPSLRG